MKKIILMISILILMSGIASAALTDGLVSYWDFDEGAGSTAYDSADGNDGTLGGDPLWVTGKVGNYALDFDGSGDYVNLPNEEWFNRSDPFTFSVWIRPHEIRSGRQAVINLESIGELSIQIDDNSGSFTSVPGSAYLSTYDGIRHIVNTDTAISTTEWTHIVGVAEGEGSGGLKIYRNGILESDKSSYGTRHWAGYNSIGGRYSAGSKFWFNGITDDVGVWNRALSSSEVSQLYNSGDGNNPLGGNVNGGGNAIPEFSSMGMVLALLIAGLGIALVIKKRR